MLADAVVTVVLSPTCCALLRSWLDKYCYELKWTCGKTSRGAAVKFVVPWLHAVRHQEGAAV
jgi:hypothetical protein